MSHTPTPPSPRRSRVTAAGALILLTALACLLAIAFRTPLRSRYWAWQITRAPTAAERAMYLTLLCNAGNGARWGTGALLEHANAELRQFGIVVLHHVRTTWARDRLLQLLSDSDDTVRELAAVGLAIHGDDSVIPELQQMYLSAKQPTATTACIALGRLATPGAVTTLTELAAEPADVPRRAALVDAFAEIGEPACVPPLLILLEDHRPCDVPTRTSKLAQDALHNLQTEVPLPPPAIPPALQPSDENDPATIAERAAAALARITGVNPPFASDLPPRQHEAARQQWVAWHTRALQQPQEPAR